MRPSRGASLLEVVIVLTVIGVLITISTPSFRRSLEQTHADVAGANLRAIWNAQRLYWLELRTYATALSDLETFDLVDSSIVAGSARYSYSITAADAVSFTAAATRVGSTRWSGQFTISESGQLAGVISATGETDITPGFQ